MPRYVFYSFCYDDDATRVQQVKNMGKLESQPLLNGNKWEEVRQGGDSAIEKWIREQMKGKSCLLVLNGTNTAGRPWVKFEIETAWQSGLGVAGIHINGLKDLATQRTSARGANPFAQFELDGTNLSAIVPMFTPTGSTSADVYASISQNIASIVEDAIRIRAKYR